MRKILVPVALALVMGGSSFAFAATPQAISGTVKSFDLKAHTLILDNGITYTLPATFKDPGLKAGAKVKVMWEMNGKAYQADSVSLG